MNLQEYSQHDGLGLAELVRRREISAAELAECARRAIAAVNPQVNAVIETYAAKPAAGAANAPFQGVPFLLKDIGSHDADVTFELGSRLTKGMRAPPFASELVNRFKASGVTIMGRTNVPELGSSCTTEPLLHGPTRNPWNLDRTPGGSSGGATAAVASGMVPIAHANDAGGSIRWPASCCGLFGLKPSRNLNPAGPDEALQVNGFAAEHIVSRSVRDSAAMLDVTAGPDAGAWCYTPRINGSYLHEAMKPAGRLRIGLNLNANFPKTEMQAEVVDAIRDSAALCESLGHYVEEATVDFEPEAAMRCNWIIWATGLHQGVKMLSQLTGRAASEETLEPHLLAICRAGAEMTADDLQWALHHVNEISRSYGRFFEKYDVMLNPTGAQEPFPIGHFGALDTSDPFAWYRSFMAHCPFTASVNMAGIPAMSVPLSWSRSGLPIGSHFVGALGNEGLLFRLAGQLEAARPWAQHLPPVHVSHISD